MERACIRLGRSAPVEDRARTRYLSPIVAFELAVQPLRGFTGGTHRCSASAGATATSRGRTSACALRAGGRQGTRAAGLQACNAVHGSAVTTDTYRRILLGIHRQNTARPVVSAARARGCHRSKRRVG
ncbi:hypothetical protein GUJ93_ZPchr0008g11489 [Zizania palustris]|uniref:Uncharacterized protein n=1 Tax=Zizania palustris TaxID=103762 RepID=A0A8J5V560_ZIZPA|nr:hypothetical protein GUJ93_ZPchr0008g11489 [Zizania palustris]